MFRDHAQKDGFAILIVLVAVVIMMLLYFVQIDAFFGPGLPSTPAGIEEHPWVLEDLLAPDGQKIKLPRSPKLLIIEPFTLAAPVSRNDADRGMVQLAFEMDGRIHSQWQCTYEQSGVDYKIDAAMKGNIDVKRTYRDDEGKDKSRLFFIARGNYTKMPVDPTATTGGEKGTCWLIGWINPDRSVDGHVTITQNEEWAAAYAFGGPQ